MQNEKGERRMIRPDSREIPVSTEKIGGNPDTAFLKLLALALMLIDHLGATLLPKIPELRIIGRMAFPLYAWCLVVGSVKTRSPLRYGLRLLVMAVVSQPLYMMALNHTWANMNILFTLLIALVAIQGIRVNRYGSAFWVPALCFFALSYLKVDYGWKGVAFIIVLYLARERRSGLCAAFLAYSLFWGSTSSVVRSFLGIDLAFSKLGELGTVLGSFFRLQGMIWLALPLIACTTHTHLRMPKWLGYGLYPLHLVLLIILKLLNGYTLQTLMNGF